MRCCHTRQARELWTRVAVADDKSQEKRATIIKLSIDSTSLAAISAKTRTHPQGPHSALQLVHSPPTPSRALCSLTHVSTAWCALQGRCSTFPTSAPTAHTVPSPACARSNCNGIESAARAPFHCTTAFSAQCSVHADGSVAARVHCRSRRTDGTMAHGTTRLASSQTPCCVCPSSMRRASCTAACRCRDLS
jgi:hypothetical protein